MFLHGHKRITMVIGISLAMGLALTGCRARSIEPRPLPKIHPPLADQTAEILALVTSGEIVAPVGLYETVHADLERIRAGWCLPSHELCRITPQPDWGIGRLHVYVETRATLTAMRQGHYRHWEDLNKHYDLEDVSFYEHAQNGIYRATLDFRPRLNPAFLEADYAALPGVTSATRSLLAGDRPNVHLELDGDTRYYSFRNAWGDCPAGCTEEHWWYFHADGDTVHYDGDNGNRAVLLLQLRRLPSFGFCPPVDEVFSADLYRDENGAHLLLGTWLDENDMITMPCLEGQWECLIEVPFGPIELWKHQVEEYNRLVAAIPDEHVPPDGACDGCVIDEYWLRNRRVVADVCAFGHSDEFWESVNALESYLHELVFDTTAGGIAGGTSQQQTSRTN